MNARYSQKSLHGVMQPTHNKSQWLNSSDNSLRFQKKHHLYTHSSQKVFTIVLCALSLRRLWSVNSCTLALAKLLVTSAQVPATMKLSGCAVLQKDPGEKRPIAMLLQQALAVQISINPMPSVKAANAEPEFWP